MGEPSLINFEGAPLRCGDDETCIVVNENFARNSECVFSLLQWKSKTTKVITFHNAGGTSAFSEIEISMK
jgi:hypothetical protein